jgi:NADPH2:quinone reductase
VLELRDVPAPVPKPGDVLVEIHARGVNFADTETRRARYRVPELPCILGSEGAGVVIDTGAGVDPAWRGRRVALYAPRPAVSGTYAELATCPVEALMPLPDALDFVTAAAVPAQGLTAYLLVVRAARIGAGHVVLIHAAAGGVGLIAVQLARKLGARVLGVVSSDDKAGAVRDAGGEPLRQGDDLVDRVRALTDGRGVDVVLDSIGLPTQAASMAMLAPFGELVHFGDAGGFPAPINPDDLYARSIKISAFGLDERHERLGRGRLIAVPDQPDPAAGRGSRGPPADREPRNDRQARAHAVIGGDCAWGYEDLVAAMVDSRACTSVTLQFRPFGTGMLFAYSWPT